GNVLDALGRVERRTRLAGRLLGGRIRGHILGRAFVTRRGQVQRQRRQIPSRLLRRTGRGVRRPAIGHVSEQKDRQKGAEGVEQPLVKQGEFLVHLSFGPLNRCLSAWITRGRWFEQ